MLDKNTYYGPQQTGGGQFHLKTPNFKKVKKAGIGVVVGAVVLLTASQEALFGSVDTYIIPDYYFNFELREAGELW